MREYMSIAVRNNMHFVLYRYCCKGRYSVNIHLKCREKVTELDHNWRVAIVFIYFTNFCQLIAFLVRCRVGTA